MSGAQKVKNTIRKSPIDQILLLLLLGTRQPESSLYFLRGGLANTLLRDIWQMIKLHYDRIVVPTTRVEDLDGEEFDHSKRDFALLRIKSCHESFPKPSNLRCTNLPFIYGQKKTLPTEFHPYWDLIMLCNAKRRGQIAYLTVDEGEVEKGHTQRTPGLHCESARESVRLMGESTAVVSNYYSWGGVRTTHQEIKGGIFFANSVSNTCAVFHGRILHPEENVGTHGSLEHLRQTLARKCKVSLIKSGALHWMTGETPHEALPMKRSGPRQFFRLIAADLDGWWIEHSTENPLCPVPEDKIIRGDKFKGKSYK
jgi:hypothetical protein